jgi:hypothetical protein
MDVHKDKPDGLSSRGVKGLLTVQAQATLAPTLNNMIDSTSRLIALSSTASKFNPSKHGEAALASP